MLWQVRRGLISGRGALDAASVATTTTWNPSAASAKFTLSPGNLIATYTDVTGGTFESVKGAASHSTGKYYYEAVVSENTSNFCFPGMGNAAASVNAYAGSDTNGVGWVASGNVLLGGSGIATIQTFAVGDTLGIAVDLAASPPRIWFRTNNGNWNNDPSANPATNVGGLDISGLAAGPYFPMATGSQTNNQIAANFGGSAYAQTPPSGFGNW